MHCIMHAICSMIYALDSIISQYNVCILDTHLMVYALEIYIYACAWSKCHSNVMQIYKLTKTENILRLNCTIFHQKSLSTSMFKTAYASNAIVCTKNTSNSFCRALVLAYASFCSSFVRS